MPAPTCRASCTRRSPTSAYDSPPLPTGNGRARRAVLGPDGRRVLLAAAHPGRASLKTQDAPLAMANRHELLARILRVLSHPGIDGFMSTPDIVEDLLILAGLIRERG